MKKCFVAFGELFETHEQLAEAVVPGMSSFNDPTPVLRGTATSTPLPGNPREIAVSDDRLLGRLSVISLVSIEEATGRSLRGHHDNGIEDGTELSNVIPVCSGHDQRQRDATPVHQQMSLAAIFFPDPLGSVLQPLHPSET